MMYGERRIPKHLILKPHYEPRRRPRIGWAWISLALTILLLSMMVASFAKAQDAEELQTGKLIYKLTDGQTQTALHLDTHVEAKLSGLIAQVTYVQTFKNDSNEWREGIYKFPLPENAAVNHMEMRIGERVIIGEIKEKQEAKKMYQAAKKSGKRAALTEQERPNLFTQKVANIAPNETIEVTLRYLHKIEFDAGLFEWRLPTTFTPRYIPGAPLANQADGEHNLALTTSDFGWALSTAQVPDANKITPPMMAPSIPGNKNQFSLSLILDGGLPLASIDALFHDVIVTKDGGQHRITLKNRREDMNRDFVLQWLASNDHQPAAAVFTEEVEGEKYAMLMMLPPYKDTQKKLSRDIVFIVDTSGSMQGNSIVQAKESLSMALKRLTPADRFNVIEFNSSHSTLFSSLQHADNSTVQQAVNWVGGLIANGGTNMAPALNAAFDSIQGSEQLQQIVFITDGAVGNEAALFKTIHSKLNSTRLFTVGIGSAPNSYFMRKAAEFGRGSFIYIGDQNEVASKMSNLFLKLENAISTNIDVRFSNAVEQYPSSAGDLYAGEPLIVSAKLLGDVEEITVTGELADSAWQQTINLPKTHMNTGVSQLWARAKIEQIEDDGITGKKTQEQVKSDIIEISLLHKLVSRFTSFVAVEQEIARPAEKQLNSQALANQVAQGQNLHKVMYPQTATTAEIAWWLGLFAFICFILLRRMNDEEL